MQLYIIQELIQWLMAFLGAWRSIPGKANSVVCHA